MKLSGLNQSELIDAYKKEIRSILELAVPVWSGGLTLEQSIQIERVQKSALAAIMGNRYTSYEDVLKCTNLEKLSTRRDDISLRFITKNMKSVSPFLTKVTKKYDTRSDTELVQEFQCKTQTFFAISLPHLARLYNSKLKSESCKR